MENVAEGVTGGGALRPSESVQPSTEVMRSIASFVAMRGLVIAGSGDDPEASSSGVVELLKQGDRSRMLLDLADKIRPYGVDVDRWLTWFSGGNSPLLVNRVERPVTDPRATSAILDRKSKQLVRMDAKLETARLARDAAVKVVEDLEAQTQLVRAANAAVLEFAIFEHIAKLMNSTLAVGPMWTLARAISATDMHDNTDVSTLSDARRQLYEAALVKRREDTDTIFAALDFMCGDMRFEDHLRNAILHLIETVEPEIEKRRASGHKARPLWKVRTTMAAESADEVRQVMDGLPQI